MTAELPLLPAVKLRRRKASPATTDNPVGWPGRASGGTLTRGEDSAHGPAAGTATTATEYSVPSVMPATEHDVTWPLHSTVTALAEIGVAVTTYFVTAAPPSEAGATQETSAEALLDSATTEVGASG